MEKYFRLEYELPNIGCIEMSAIRIDVKKAKDVWFKPTVYKVNYPTPTQYINANIPIPDTEPTEPQIVVNFDDLPKPTIETVKGKPPEYVKYAIVIHLYTYSGTSITGYFKPIVNGTEYDVLTANATNNSIAFYFLGVGEGDTVALKVWASDTGGNIVHWATYISVIALLPSKERCYYTVAYKYTPPNLSSEFGSVYKYSLLYIYYALLFSGVLVGLVQTYEGEKLEKLLKFNLVPIDSIDLRPYGFANKTNDVLMVQIRTGTGVEGFGGIEYAIIV